MCAQSFCSGESLESAGSRRNSTPEKRLLSLHVNLKKEKTRLDRIRSLNFDRQAT
jgi:hypothetical protein